MIKHFILFKGHPKFKDILHIRSIIQLKTAVANHASAHGLKILVSPSSPLAHWDMDSSDKGIWDKAYMEEINGLNNRHTLQTITEPKFQKLRLKVKAVLPSMGISTIKIDVYGKPKRAKY